MNKSNYKIAIDGHSSCGKSTVAKELAKKLHFLYVDTGAMYRAVTLFCLENDLIHDNKVDEFALINIWSQIKIGFQLNQNTTLNEITLNGKVVEDRIRKMDVSEMVSPVSKLKFVRENLVAMQRMIGMSNNIVMDGRDIGTVVFPNATLKIFMTAKPEVRAKRRYDELIAKGEKVSLEEITKNVIDRDFQDENRTESPLRKADDAYLLDNSDLSREEQLEWIIEKVNVTDNLL